MRLLPVIPLLLCAGQLAAQPDPPPDPGDPRVYSLYKSPPPIKPPTPDVHEKYYQHLYRFPSPPTNLPPPQYGRLALRPRSFSNPVFNQYHVVTNRSRGTRTISRRNSYGSVHAPIQGFEKKTRWQNFKKKFKKPPKPKPRRGR